MPGLIAAGIETTTEVHLEPYHLECESSRISSSSVSDSTGSSSLGPAWTFLAASRHFSLPKHVDLKHWFLGQEKPNKETSQNSKTLNWHQHVLITQLTFADHEYDIFYNVVVTVPTTRNMAQRSNLDIAVTLSGSVTHAELTRGHDNDKHYENREKWKTRTWRWPSLTKQLQLYSPRMHKAFPLEEVLIRTEVSLFFPQYRDGARNNFN